MRTTLPAERVMRTAGFGIVEVIVSMFLLSIMAMAFLPVLVQALQMSKVNASIATATQLLSADLDSARQLDLDCGSFPDSDFIAKGEFTVSRTWDSCAGDIPTTVLYTSSVSATGTIKVLAEASTLILITG